MYQASLVGEHQISSYEQDIDQSHSILQFDLMLPYAQPIFKPETPVEAEKYPSA